MAKETTKGNCYLCGAAYAKSAFKRHILSAHAAEGGDVQRCALVKVEGFPDKRYWLYLDVPLTASLRQVDNFLRKIWLECCNHMSGFFDGRDMLSMTRKWSNIPTDHPIRYQYDFGSTTELSITVVGEHFRPWQKQAVRLLGRNVPLVFPCCRCGAPADFIDVEERYSGDALLCEQCLTEEEQEHFLLPVVNSPRMGECGYTGQQDIYQFRPENYTASAVRERTERVTPENSVSREVGPVRKTLSEEDRTLFFALWHPLVTYVNNRFSIVPVSPDHTDAMHMPLSELLTVARYLWENKSLIDDYLAENPDIPEEHRQIISDWKRAKTGIYILERHLKGGSIFLTENGQVYLVKGIQSTWEEMFEGWHLPILLDATLIPFRGVIITDGLLLPHKVGIGPNLAYNFKQRYLNAKAQGKVRTQL